jgi:hypothetical protein
VTKISVDCLYISTWLQYGSKEDPLSCGHHCTSHGDGDGFCLLFLSSGIRMMEVSQNRALQEQAVGKKSKLCHEKLDELDTCFNLQRSNRQEYVKEGMQGSKVWLFDEFEPESVCFSKERFGSSECFS